MFALMRDFQSLATRVPRDVSQPDPWKTAVYKGDAKPPLTENMIFCSDFDGQAFRFGAKCDFDKSNVHYNEAITPGSA